MLSSLSKNVMELSNQQLEDDLLSHNLVESEEEEGVERYLEYDNLTHTNPYIHRVLIFKRILPINIRDTNSRRLGIIAPRHIDYTTTPTLWFSVKTPIIQSCSSLNSSCKVKCAIQCQVFPDRIVKGFYCVKKNITNNRTMYIAFCPRNVFRFSVTIK